MSAASRFAGGPARLALVAIVLGGLVAASELPGSSRAATAAPAVPTPGPAARTLVCPSAPVVAGVSGRGRVALRSGPHRGALVAAGTDRAGAVPRDLDGVVTATGTAAAGLAAEHVEQVDDGARRGLLAVRCTAPSAQTWFVGGATTAGSTTELVLREVDGAPASVDVRAWSSTGPLDRRPGRAVPVPAHGRTVLPLDHLGLDRDLLALQVTTRRGRVSAFLQTARADGRTPQGTAAVPPTLPPARDVVVPGLPAGPGGGRSS